MKLWSSVTETRAATWAKVRAVTVQVLTHKDVVVIPDRNLNIPTSKRCLNTTAHSVFCVVLTGTIKAVDHVNKDIAPKLIEKVSISDMINV